MEMSNPTNMITQRLLRKGALVEETYLLFRNWDDTSSMEINFDRNFEGHFRTIAWSAEVKTTLKRRFAALDAAAPLIITARGGLPLEEWRHCLLLWIGSRETLYREFALEWLYPEFEKGRYQVKPEDIRPFVQSLWQRINKQAPPLSDYGIIRTARDLVRMACDLGVLVGKGSAKTFSPLRLTDRCFLYYAHILAEAAGATAKLQENKYWRLALIRPEEVVETILRLHQFRKLEYEAAGSLVQLNLPYDNAREYAKRMVA